MHQIHRILIKFVNNEENLLNRADLICKARWQADEYTSSFQNIVYDWRETDTAGRFSTDYPENVLLGKEKKEKIICELQKCRELQCGELHHSLHEIKEVTTDLTVLVEKIWSCDTFENSGLYSLHLSKIAKILNGEYSTDSYFYDTELCTAKITTDTFDLLEKEPEKWALVLFDCHY